MLKNTFFIFVNIVGLSVAIGCAIVAYLNLDFDVAFDKDHRQVPDIYPVSSIRAFESRSTLSGFAVPATCRS